MADSDAPVSAAALIDLLADPTPGSDFVSWDSPPQVSGLDESYRAAVERARERSGGEESVRTGQVRVGEHDLALVVGDFAFLAGSVGRAAAARIIAALRRATAEGLPVLAVAQSGGTRMQEGTPAFVTMADITAAVLDHRAAGLPFLVHLRHPTTGGVLASWGSLGQVTTAEPGALIGFLGPAVYEALEGAPFPPGVQQAEHLLERGIIDAVVAPADLAARVGRTLDLLGPAGTAPPAPPAASIPAASPPERRWGREPAPFVSRPEPPPEEVERTWASIELTRRSDRPGLRVLLEQSGAVMVALSGTGAGEVDPAVVVGLVEIGGRRCVLVGQDRLAQRDRPMGPWGLRAARRGMSLAAELGLPLVTIIDTPGAELSVAAEEGAMAGEIARSLADLVSLSVPSVAVLLGEGCGGGALALLPARRIIAAEHAWLSPLPPEGASVIVTKGVDAAPLLAARQRVAARCLHEDDIVDVVVPEPVPAHEDPAGFCAAVWAAIAAELEAQGE